MTSTGREQFDVIVVGAGPAGIAAATRAAERGARVAVVDDNPALGGQIWRGGAEKAEDMQAREWMDRFRKTAPQLFTGTRVIGQQEPGELLAEERDVPRTLRYRAAILATGARERYLPFPGWTLPNVTGAGGLQALVKSGLPIRGKRVVVAGSGPLLLAVAAYLRQHGAEIPLICEQTSWARLLGFGFSLVSQPSKIVQGLKLKFELGSVPFAANCWPLAAHGSEHLESVVVSRDGEKQEIACDYLACGFHLVPNNELAVLLGCELRGGFVVVDDLQRTSAPAVFCAGEPTGIGGVDLALIEGEIAGLAAAGDETAARALFANRRKLQKFVTRLARTFAPREELKSLASPETIVCRCEDVTFARIGDHVSSRAAKLHTRCGMGPCQGRVCGPAMEFLFSWEAASVRPPVFPARVASLSGMEAELELESDRTTGGIR